MNENVDPCENFHKFVCGNYDPKSIKFLSDEICLNGQFILSKKI